MNDHHHPQQQPDLAELCRRLEDLPGAVKQLERIMARNALAGSFLRMQFSAAKPRYTDDVGADALALGIYNPTNFRIYVGLGGDAASDSFVVPKQKLVVAPIQVNGAIQFLADEGEVGAGGFAWRVRFPTPQPFAAHSLA